MILLAGHSEVLCLVWQLDQIYSTFRENEIIELGRKQYISSSSHIYLYDVFYTFEK